MATAVAAPENALLRSSEESVALASQLRRLARVGTYVAILVSPAAYFFFRTGRPPELRLVDRLHGARRPRLPRVPRPRHPPAHPLAEPLRHRRLAPPGGGHRQPPPRLDVAVHLPGRDLPRRDHHDRLPQAELVRPDPPHLAGHGRRASSTASATSCRAGRSGSRSCSSSSSSSRTSCSSSARC